MLRHLRFAPAVDFALLALAFVGLWVRSYAYHDAVPLSSKLSVGSNRGALAFVRNGPTESNARLWTLRTYPLSLTPAQSWADKTFAGFGSFGESSATFVLFLPHWFLAASSLGLAALLACKRTWRYSLRTILVATTLLAAVLGLAVYAV